MAIRLGGRLVKLGEPWKPALAGKDLSMTGRDVVCREFLVKPWIEGA